MLTVINLPSSLRRLAWAGAWTGFAALAAQLGAGTLAVPSPPAGVKDWPVIGHAIVRLWDQASTNLRTLLQWWPASEAGAGTMLGLAGDAGAGTLKVPYCGRLTGFLLPGRARGWSRAAEASCPGGRRSEARILWRWRARRSVR